ncbi:uncharacterized protein LOC121732634 isoform X2 [Aricia agestis]|nr:uncharacterized protein LOC121732634 isoform X2 [Aricia agestis]
MDSSSLQSYQDMKSNPYEVCKLISRYVKIDLIKNSVLKGFLSSVDPVTYSIILLVPQENQKEYQKVLIPGHAVLDLTVEDSEEFTEVPVTFSLTSTSTDHKKRKEKVMEWFRLNLLTVTECDDNILFGNVTILPPYDVEDICTDNPIIAMQVKKVMEKMPEDFNSQLKNTENS